MNLWHDDLGIEEENWWTDLLIQHTNILSIYMIILDMLWLEGSAGMRNRPTIELYHEEESWCNQLGNPLGYWGDHQLAWLQLLPPTKMVHAFRKLQKWWPTCRYFQSFDGCRRLKNSSEAARTAVRQRQGLWKDCQLTEIVHDCDDNDFLQQKNGKSCYYII